MNIHEHQAKQILKKYGVPVPEGIFALTVGGLIEKLHYGMDFDLFAKIGLLFFCTALCVVMCSYYISVYWINLQKDDIIDAQEAYFQYKLIESWGASPDTTIISAELNNLNINGMIYYLDGDTSCVNDTVLYWGNLGRAISPCNYLSYLDSDEFMLMTMRSHDQFNTTIYGLDDRYRGVYNERRVVFINKEDMKDLGLQKLDVVNLTSTYDGVVRTARKFLIVPYNIPKGNVAAYFPETNILVPYNHFAERSQTPISKSVKVRIEKVAAAEQRLIDSSELD